jgi:parallel beta-helix repeat protein
MNRFLRICFLLLLLSGARIPLLAATLYVDVNCTNPIPPYADWTSGAQTIQDAVDAANDGDLVLVTNGVYQTGGRVVYGALTNRVAVTRALTLQSINGPNVTIIRGNNQVNFPSVNVRCVYLTNGAILSGFTLTNGGTLIFSSAPEVDGAGVWCESTTALVSNCVITGSAAFGNGGGAYSGSLANCTLTGNSARIGGGAAAASLTNCLLLANSAQSAGGAQNCVALGCMITSNTAQFSGGGISGSGATNCTIAGNYAPYAGGAIAAFMDHCTIVANVADRANGGAGYYSQLWNCLVSGNSVTATNGQGGGLGGPITSAIDCLIISNSAPYQGGGAYSANLTNCVLAWNVCSNSGAGAFSGILEGCTLSNNYAYGYGGGSSGSTLSHCTIQANIALGGGGGVDSGILISSFVVSNYAGSAAGGLGVSSATDCSIIGNRGTDGAGVWGGNITNCLLAYNRAERVYYPRGGAAKYATLDHCTIATNFASEGAGVEGGYVYNSVLIGNIGSWGGGAAYSTLDHCAIGANVGYPAGAGGCSLAGCLVTNNIGAGTLGCWGNSCTVAGNEYGAEGGTFINSIVFGNSDENWEFDGFYGLHFTNCCTDPIPTNYITTFSSMSAAETFTNDPRFVNPAAGDYHLQSSSPCINSGKNSDVTANTDVDGNPRVKGGTVDIGAYEFQSPASKISYAWLQQFGLPIDGTVDLADTDQDGMNNWQEWICGTDPTNSLSVLKMFAPTNTPLGLALSWQSVLGRTYDLQQSDPANPTTFFSVQSNVVAQGGVTGFLDSSSTNIGSRLYRVRVQQ